MSDSAPVKMGSVAFNGTMLMGMSQGVKMAVQFISVVVLARLLLPEDFGLMASVGPVTAFVTLFQNLGLHQAIIQRKEISETQLNQIFWVLLAMGLLCSLVVMGLSPAVSWFYDDKRLLFITLFAALPIALGSITTLPLGLLNRELRFGVMALNETLSAVIGLGVAILMALAGFGYWSLLGSTFASIGVAMLISFAFCKWRPAKPDFKLDKDIFSFGANLTGFNFLNYFSRNLDNILIGRYAGAEALGYYDRAYKLLLFPLQNINEPLSRVMVPVLSKMQEDKPRLRQTYLQVLRIMGLVTIPGIAALLCMTDVFILTLFGEKWLDIVPIFFWLGIIGLFQPLYNPTGWLFIAQGKTGLMFKWGVVGSLITIASFIVGLPGGAVGVAKAYAIFNIVIILPLLYAVIQYMKPVTALDMIKVQLPLLAGAGLTWFSVQYIRNTFDLHNVVIILSAIALSYLYALISVIVFKSWRETLIKMIGLCFDSLTRFLNRKRQKTA